MAARGGLARTGTLRAAARAKEDLANSAWLVLGLRFFMKQDVVAGLFTQSEGMTYFPMMFMAKAIVPEAPGTLIVICLRSPDI
jgi:hypothetical protein